MNQTAHRRLFIVEDEALILNLMTALVKTLGYEVADTASRLNDALLKVDNNDFDLACLDVNLAGECSYPVAFELRRRKIPFIFATGYGVAGIPAALSDAPVITKPFSSRTLGKALGEVLEQSTTPPTQ